MRDPLLQKTGLNIAREHSLTSVFRFDTKEPTYAYPFSHRSHHIGSLLLAGALSVSVWASCDSLWKDFTISAPRRKIRAKRHVRGLSSLQFHKRRVKVPAAL